jgi:pantetheine-phosphate adenylyltransferase
MPDPRIALYPGTFDPITNGHLDIIRRAVRLVDHLIIAVARNAGKNPLLGVDERLELVRAEIADLRLPAGGCRVEARSFDTLLMHFAQSVGANMIVRGLRAVSDFEYEFQMALMNRKLREEIETVFLMPHEAYSYISSRLIKEVAGYGGTVTGLVPPGVEKRLTERFRRR